LRGQTDPQTHGRTGLKQYLASLTRRKNGRIGSKFGRGVDLYDCSEKANSLCGGFYDRARRPSRQ